MVLSCSHVFGADADLYWRVPVGKATLSYTHIHTYIRTYVQHTSALHDVDTCRDLENTEPSTWKCEP